MLHCFRLNIFLLIGLGLAACTPPLLRQPHPVSIQSITSEQIQFNNGQTAPLPFAGQEHVTRIFLVRHAIIRTFENKRVVIPNSVISTELVENANLIEEKICKLIDMGISYGSDVQKAKQIMREEAEKHPLTIDNRDDEQKANNDPVVMTRLIGFADSSVTLRAWVWTVDQPSAFQLGCDLYESIKARFEAEGVEIPFPHRKIVS